MPRPLSVLVLSVPLAGCVDSCVSNEDLVPGPCSTDAGALYPLEPGAWWVDRVFDTQEGVTTECKVVSVEEAAAPIEPFRPDVIAFRVLSVREDSWGWRWQEVREDGSVYRHVDEWHDLHGVRTEIMHYCPARLRVPGGERGACTNVEPWSEPWYEAEVTLADGGTWDDCERIGIDRETCEVVTEVAGCAVAVESREETWTTVAIDEERTTDAGTFTTVHFDLADDAGTSRFWWARGVGKVFEQEVGGIEIEELVDWCLPAEGCSEEAPLSADLTTDCVSDTGAP